MKIKKYFSIFCLIILGSCLETKEFTLPLSKHINDSKLNLNGYYISISDDKTQESRSVIYLLILYQNGVALEFGGLGVGKDSVSSTIKNILFPPRHHFDYKNAGSYLIENDKIEIQIMEPTHYNYHKVKKMTGRVTSDSSFTISNQEVKNNYADNYKLFYYFQASEKPDSMNRYMKRKWYSRG